MATSLTLFDIESSNDYQLEVKTRKTELSEVKVKFVVVARKELGIWKKVEFSYFATDRDDIIAGSYTAGIRLFT